MVATAPAKLDRNSAESTERAPTRSVYRPQIDVLETKDAVLVVADVPGVSEKDLDISLEKDVLTVRGKVEIPSYEGYSLVTAEYGLGDWERSFTISNEIDRGRIEATVKDGVLRLTLPKSTELASRKISVSAG